MKLKILLSFITILALNWSFSQGGTKPSTTGASINLPLYFAGQTLTGKINDVSNPTGFVSPYTIGPDYFFYHKALSSGNIFVDLSFTTIPGTQLMPSISVWEGRPGAGGILIQSLTSIGDETVDNILRLSFKSVINKLYYIMIDCGTADGYDYSLFIYNSPVQGACSNIGFETGDFSNWIETDGNTTEGCATAQHPVYFPNASLSNSTLSSAPQHRITKSGTDAIGGFKKVCPGLEGKSLRLGDSTKTMRRHNANTGIVSNGASIEQQFLVTKTNSLFTYYYAVVLEASGHAPSQQPTFRVDAFDKNGGRILCGEYLVVASGAIPGFVNAGPYDDPNDTYPLDPTDPDVYYKTWTPVFIDLSQYIDSSITVRFTVMDCSEGAHFGYAYVDAVCQPLEITGNSSVCNGGKISLHAPPGGATYKWTVKGNTTVLGNLDSLYVNPNTPTTYQCEIVSVAGCKTLLEKLITPEAKPIISTISGDLEICTGEIEQLTATGTPDGISPWKSSNTSVASVDIAGKITGLTKGNTIITFKSLGGCTRDTLVTVSESAIVTGITSFCKGATTTLTNTTQSPDPTTPWTSSNITTATVDKNGVVTGIASGSTTITFLSTTGCKTKKTITVSLTPNIINPGNLKVCDSLLLPVINGTNLNKPKYYDKAQAAGGKVISGTLKIDQTVWIFDSTGVCTDEKSFTVSITKSPTLSQPVDQNSCNPILLPILTNGNYYTGSLKGGTKLNAGDSIKSSQKVYIYDEASTNASCFTEKSFQININASVSNTPNDTTVCDYYILPAITNVTFFKGPNQTGGALLPGDSIKSTLKIYAFVSIPGPTGCTNEKNFTVTVNSSPVLLTPSDLIACDSVALPVLSIGNYYTGKLKTGLQKNANEFIKTTQDIYIYAESATLPNCFSEKTQKITIFNTPVLVTPKDTSVCDSLILPVLTIGNYYTATNQGGINYGTSAKIKTSIPMYIYAESGNTLKCKSEKVFQITVKNTPAIPTLTNLTSCDSVALPIISTGDYYTASNKGGTKLNAGDYVKSNATLFIYAETGGTPNCYAEKTKTISIKTSSLLNQMKDTTVCDSLILPTIQGTNITGFENYYASPKTTVSSPISGAIKSTAKLYYFDASDACSDQKSVTITINKSPKITNPGNQSICDVLYLKKLTGLNLSGNENYYFASQKNNGIVVSIPVINDTTLYIFDTNKGCTFEDSFKVFIGQKPKIEFMANILTGCVPFTSTFINSSTNLGDTSIWYFGNDSIIVLGDKPVVNYTFTDAKCYDIKFKTSNNGCANSLTKQNMVCGSSTPIADFDFQPTTVSILDPKITFINKTSTDATSYFWDFGDDSYLKEKNPTHSYLGKAQEYVVTLIASNAAKCSSQKVKTINILDEFIYYVPNSFTPDGDNLNNTFTPVLYSGFDPQSYTFTIFDRWGEILFVSHDASVGWDGTYGNNICLVGAYTWTIQVKTILTKEMKKLHGHVNLIR